MQEPSDYMLSIVIVNYMSYEDTISYVNKLLHQKKVDLQVVVVDNASPNESFQRLSKAFSEMDTVHILDSGRNGGYSYGNNIGIKFVEQHQLSDLVVISNNDIEFKEDHFLHNLIKSYNALPHDKAFAAPLMCVGDKISNIAGKKLPTFKMELIRSSIIISSLYGRKTNYDFLNGGSFLSVDCLPGSFFLGSLSIFKKIKFFDENIFLFGEERIVAHKVKSLGYCNYLLCNLHFFHHQSKTIDNEIKLIEKLKFRNKSKLYFWKTYSNISDGWILFLKIYLRLCELENLLFWKLRKIFHFCL